MAADFGRIGGHLLFVTKVFLVYNNPMDKLFSFIKQKPIIAVFFLILLASFVWHEGFRNKHFQECDSAGVYFLLQEFPKSGLTYATLAYPPGHIINAAQAEKILKIPVVNKLATKFFGGYTQNEMVDRLSNVNPFALWRYAEITGISLARLPYFLQSIFAMPLSSTYSAGMGLVYGLITSRGLPYEAFMSRILFVNILFFHACVLLLFSILKRLKASDGAAVIASLLMLFSISMYTQGYSAGSVLWIFGSELLWIWYALKNAEDKNLLKKVSWISGILVFFNYLIALFWLGLTLALWYQKVKTSNNRLAEGWKLLKSQIAALVLISLCAGIFYQPGQGGRGSTSFPTFFRDTYYVVLNFFSFYTHSNFWNIAQFALGLILIAFFAYCLFKRKIWEPTSELKLFRDISAGFFVIFFLCLLLKILGFAPNRQMFMLAPFVFIGSGIVIDQLSKKLPAQIQTYLFGVLILLLTLAGARSLKIRRADALDRTANINIDPNVSLIGVYDCSFNLTYRNWHTNIPVDFINPKQFEAGKIYLYLSQTFPFETALKDWEKKYNISATTLYTNNVVTEVYFLAHNPNFQAYLFTRPNNLFETKFQVNSISKK